MKLTVVVLVILHSVTCKRIHFPLRPHCSQQTINYYRKEYAKEIYSEIDDLKGIQTTHSSCTRSVEHKLGRLRRDIKYARLGNNNIVNQCLDGLSRADNIANSYKDVLRTECYLNIERKITSILLASSIATSEVEICLNKPGSSCSSIKRCCKKVEDSFEYQNYDREVRRLLYGYKQCVRRKCQRIERTIFEIKTGITTCTQLTTTVPTEAPAVTTGAPLPPTTAASVFTTTAPQSPTTGAPSVTSAVPQPPMTAVPAVTSGTPQQSTTSAPTVTTTVPQPPTTAAPSVTTGTPQTPTTAAPSVISTMGQPPTTAATAVTSGAVQPSTTAAPAVTSERHDHLRVHLAVCGGH